MYEREAEVRELVDRYRDRCLWYLRQDYYPTDAAEAVRVLESIERYGDREAFAVAEPLRRWLSRRSNGGSAH